MMALSVAIFYFESLIRKLSFFRLEHLTFVFAYTPWSKTTQQSGKTWRAEMRPEDAPRLPRLQSPWRLCFQLGHRNRLPWMQTRSLSDCVSVFRTGYRSMSPYCCWDRGCWFGRGRCTASLSPWLFTLYSGKCRFNAVSHFITPFDSPVRLHSLLTLKRLLRAYTG